MDDDHGSEKHKLFLTFTHNQLLSDRQHYQTKYSNLQVNSNCCLIIRQTLEELQILKESYEDGVLSIMKVDSTAIEIGLEKILLALQRHFQLQGFHSSTYI